MQDPLENIKQCSRFPLLLLLFQSSRQQIRWELLGNLILTFCASDIDGYGLQMFTGTYGICIFSSGVMKYTVFKGKDNRIININQCSCSLNDCGSVMMEFHTCLVFIHRCISFPHSTLQVKICFSNSSLVSFYVLSENETFFLDTNIWTKMHLYKQNVVFIKRFKLVTCLAITCYLVFLQNIGSHITVELKILHLFSLRFSNAGAFFRTLKWSRC